MVFAQVMFASMNVLSRLGSQHLPWTEVAGTRFLVGAVVVVAVARVRGSALRTHDRRGTWYRSIFGTLASLGFFYSITSPRIALGDAVTIGSTAPILVAVLSVPLLGERVGRHVGLAVLLAFAGVVGVARPAFHAAALEAGAAVSSAFFYAMAIIWLRRMGPNESSEAIVLHFSLVAAGTLLLLALPAWQAPGERNLAYMLGTGITGGLGQIGMTRAYGLSRAAPMSALTYLNIVFTTLLAIPVFGERVGTLQIAGAGLVILAGLILTWHAGLPPASTDSAGPRLQFPE